IAQSHLAHAKILSCDLSGVIAQPGVVAVLTLDDIPGSHDISCAHADDEPLFAKRYVQFAGQALFAVVAESVDAARRASKFANIDRKSTRLNSSHVKISYAVFCLKKKTT